MPVTVNCPSPGGCAAQTLPFNGKVGKIRIAGKLSVPALRSGRSITVKIVLGKKTVPALLKAGKRKVTLTIQTASGPVKITVTLKQAKKH